MIDTLQDTDIDEEDGGRNLGECVIAKRLDNETL